MADKNISIERLMQQKTLMYAHDNNNGVTGGMQNFFQHNRSICYDHKGIT